MKKLRYLIGFTILGFYSCSSIYTSDVYTDDVYYNHKKDSEESKYSAYSPSATYSNAPNNSQPTTSSSATVNGNLDYNQAQNYYNTQSSTDGNDAQLNGSYSERIAKFYGPLDSVDYNSPVYSTVVDPNSNVNVYVNNYPQEQAYYDDNSNWNFSVGIGVGYGVGFYGGFYGGYGYPYYGYYDPFYGYGYPYYGYGYPYYPYYGCGYPSYGCGGVYVSPYSEYNYGPRPNGGSTAVGSQGGSSSYRAPRSATNQNTTPTVNPLKSSGAERYAQPQRSSSYSSYSRTSKSATVKSTQTGATGTTQPVTYRRSYTPTYNQPATNARTQYNNSNYTRPTSNTNTQSSTIKSSDNKPTVVGSQPASKPTNTQTYQRSNSSAPSTPSYNSGGSSSGGGRSSGGSMGGGGSSGGGGGRSPRR